VRVCVCVCVCVCSYQMCGAASSVPLLHLSLICVALCCSVLQCVAVCCSALQCVVLRCSVLQCVAVCCSALHCDATCMQWAVLCCSALPHCCILHCVEVSCNVWQCVAVRCSVLQSRYVVSLSHQTNKYQSNLLYMYWMAVIRRLPKLPGLLQHTATHCNTLQHIVTIAWIAWSCVTREPYFCRAFWQKRNGFLFINWVQATSDDLCAV